RSQDGRLNKAYKALLAAMTSTTEKEAATDAQRAWLAFFAKDCAARAARFGLNAAPATESICRMESTAIRAQQIEDWRGSLSSRKP
ncbi:MAG: lysozyme inhibitor LprI family protein, partial [Luteibacter sp.]